MRGRGVSEDLAGVGLAAALLFAGQVRLLGRGKEQQLDAPVALGAVAAAFLDQAVGIKVVGHTVEIGDDRSEVGADALPDQVIRACHQKLSDATLALSA